MNAVQGLPEIPPAPTSQTDNSAAHRWQDALAPSGSGYLGDERNILIALRAAPELAGLVSYNEFALEIELTRDPPWRVRAGALTWNEVDDTQLVAWLQAADLKVRSRGAVADSVIVAARDRSFHPVWDYLASLSWDGEPRLQVWLSKYLNAQADPEYLRAIGVKFLVSAVARVLRPGCQADHVLVLEGAQGIGKTTAARTLATRPEWFAGNLPDIHSKDAPLQLAGRWIVEIAELKAIRNSQVEAVKSFLSETHDTFRPPYGRRTAQFPRQCVFIATTNEREYLRDRTGNRRYWPVHCERVDIPALANDRDQLWAEAVQRFQEGHPWHLTDEEASLAGAEQTDRLHLTELEQDVREYLGALLTDTVTVRDVLVYGLRMDPAKHGYTDSARKLGPAVADALERWGWQKDRRRGQQRRTTYAKKRGTP